MTNMSKFIRQVFIGDLVILCYVQAGAYDVQSADPNHRDWDDWPLRMTFHINSFLREQGPVGEPDLAALGFLDD